MADQSNERSYRLICGVFSPDEAKEVLMTLIEDKISFHRRNNWRQRECFGETDTLGVKRIDELRQTKEEVATLIAEVNAVGKRLRINCNIEIGVTSEQITGP